MANYVFERMTQEDAAAFTAATDNLYFIDTAPADLAVTFQPGTSLTQASITLTAGEQSLTFAADQLSQETPVFLTEAGGALVLGGAGADAGLTSTENEARIFGFAGADVIAIGDPAATEAQTGFVDAGADNDTVTINGYTASGEDDDLISGGFTVYGGAGADSITATAGFNHIYGNAATAAAGTVDGADTITVSGGSNYIQGNAGADQITVAAANADDMFGSRVQGGADGDTITLTNHGDNAVNGNKGADTINASGADGNSSLRGGADNDTITAGAGSDVLQGDAGNDTLVAGGTTATNGMVADEGNGAFSTLTGGVGDDVFDVSTAAKYVTDEDGFVGTVTITDFRDAGADTIDLGFDVNANDAANNVTTNLLFAPNATFTTVDAAIIQANTLLAGHTGDDVAAIAVGSDTYLFIGDTSVESIVKLAGTVPSAITVDSFVHS